MRYIKPFIAARYREYGDWGCFWVSKKISRPAVLGRVMRMRRHRVGQMELFCKIKPKKRIEKQHYDKVYC